MRLGVQCGHPGGGRVYSSELAERAKRNATKGYETTDEINYHQGECWYTSFTIHRKKVEDEVESDADY